MQTTWNLQQNKTIYKDAIFVHKYLMLKLELVVRLGYDSQFHRNLWIGYHSCLLFHALLWFNVASKHLRSYYDGACL